jgi:FMN phosphatase YigB (HAD superfamily)
MDIIFDIDGTLANTQHRMKYIKSTPKNWKLFFSTSTQDEVYQPVLDTLLAFKAQGHRIIIMTGRPSNQCEADTIAWLTEKGIYQHVDALYMRKPKDSRPDYVAKGELLDDAIADGYDPKFVFDDRPGVIAMFRERGLYVFNCDQVGTD